MINQPDSAYAPILIAVPDEWQIDLRQFLEKEGYPVLVASSRDDALAAIQSRTLRGIIVVSEWAIASEDGKTPGLMNAIKGRIPSVTLIRKTGDYRWFDEAYYPPFHEYCSIPFSFEELCAFMRRAKMI